jgi:hypothetical protein
MTNPAGISMPAGFVFVMWNFISNRQAKKSFFNLSSGKTYFKVTTIK